MNKEYKDIKHYGEWFLKLLNNHKYCLRRRLHRTHLHLFKQLLKVSWKGPAINPKVRILVERYSDSHYNNN